MRKGILAVALIVYAMLALGTAVRSATPAPAGAPKAPPAGSTGAPPATSPGTAPPPGTMPPPGMMPPGGMAPPPPVATDSFATERDSLMNEVLQHIAGRENAPAESVFKNIKMFKGFPAGRLMRVMNYGWGRGLGTQCQHCHVLGHWADEDKAPKQIARDMGVMVDSINTALLPRIKNLHSEHPRVNCTTCHRGKVIPATNM